MSLQPLLCCLHSLMFRHGTSLSKFRFHSSSSFSFSNSSVLFHFCTLHEVHAKWQRCLVVESTILQVLSLSYLGLGCLFWYRQIRKLTIIFSERNGSLFIFDPSLTWHFCGCNGIPVKFWNSHVAMFTQNFVAQLFNAIAYDFCLFHRYVDNTAIGKV